jgi:hypothetical protein
MATRELQADGLTLLTLPLILRAIRTPGTEQRSTGPAARARAGGGVFFVSGYILG